MQLRTISGARARGSTQWLRARYGPHVVQTSQAKVKTRESPLRYWVKNAVYASGVPAFAMLMRTALSRAADDRERVRLARNLAFRGFSLRPYQVEDEIVQLLAELRARGVERAVEIGTARGGTLSLLLQALQPSAHVVSVDLHFGPFGGGYPHWKIPLFHALAVGGPRLTLLRGSSQTPAMRSRVEQVLGAKADFILIDGDHSYEGAARDFELYRDLVRPGGIIAFHDIVSGSEGRVGGVPRLWQELKQRYAHRELVKDWQQGGFGIGLLFVSDEP
jgi:predicted O-methyltransferase YrrM